HSYGECGQIIGLDAVADVPYDRGPSPTRCHASNDVSLERVRMYNVNFLFPYEASQLRQIFAKPEAIGNSQHGREPKPVLFGLTNTFVQLKNMNLGVRL